MPAKRTSSRKAAPPKKRSRVQTMSEQLGIAAVRKEAGRQFRKEMAVRQVSQQEGLKREDVRAAVKRQELQRQRVLKDTKAADKKYKKEVGRKEYKETKRFHKDLEKIDEAEKRRQLIRKTSQDWERLGEERREEKRSAQHTERRKGIDRAKQVSRQQGTRKAPAARTRSESVARTPLKAEHARKVEQPLSVEEYARRAAAAKAKQVGTKKAAEFVAKKTGSTVLSRTVGRATPVLGAALAVGEKNQADFQKKYGRAPKTPYERLEARYGVEIPSKKPALKPVSTTDRQVSAFERRNPGWTIKQTANGWKTVKK